MMSALSEINVLALLAASVFSFIFGGVWYGIVVAKPYVKAMGRENQEPQKPSALFIVGPFLCSFVTLVTSAILLRTLQIDTLEGALGFGAFVGVGYLLATTQNIAINPNFPRPFFYTLINAPYFLLNSMITCSILVLMA